MAAMDETDETPTADVIDLPVKKEQLPIPAALLNELRKLQETRAALERQLGRLVASYGRQKAELVGQLAKIDESFATRGRDALLTAGVELSDDKTHWDVDLREGVIRKV